MVSEDYINILLWTKLKSRSACFFANVALLSVISFSPYSAFDFMLSNSCKCRDAFLISLSWESVCEKRRTASSCLSPACLMPIFHMQNASAAAIAQCTAFITHEFHSHSS